MDHAHFKTRETAANYVAEGLDARTQEAFELHLMDCTECLQEVEIWRAIKLEMPRSPTARANQPRRLPAGRTWRLAAHWRLAASWLGVALLGATGGWLGKSLQSTELASAQAVVFNMPALTRDADCTPVMLAPDTRVAFVRIPRLSRGLRLVALDADQHEITTALRIQPDQSELMRLDSRSLAGRDIYLQARGQDVSEPIGCITGRIR